jgi:dTMP kinase
MTATRGRFGVVEGGDGSGKSTQVARLVAALRARGLTVVQTFEPGATAAGAVIRELLLHGPDTITPEAEALLMAADRALHVAGEISPALGRGDWVVCDRYVASSLVYQGIVRGLGADVVERINDVATAGLTPDLVVVLDVPDEVAAARAGDDPDRLEREGAAFHSAVRDGYRTLARQRGWALVDGDGTVDDVAARVGAAVEPLLAG